MTMTLKVLWLPGIHLVSLPVLLLHNLKQHNFKKFHELNRLILHKHCLDGTVTSIYNFSQKN